MEDYAASCSARIKQINDSLEKRANNTLRAEELTMMQIAVLIALDQVPEKTLSQKELEQQFLVAQPTMAGIVKRLEQKGLTSSYVNPQDRRSKQVILTSKGSGKCSSGYAHMQEAEEALLHTLDEAEKAEFHRLLEKISQGLREGDR